jgi:hypothetical protein
MRCISLICTVIVLLTCAISASAQAGVAQGSDWRGLSLEISTPEDAIRILGQPAKDKGGQSLRLVLVDKWLPGGKYNQKIFRELTFKKPNGFVEARLSFLSNKLVLIDLDPRTGDVPDWVDPDDLAATFNAKFTYQEWHIGKRLPSLADFENIPSNVAPQKFAELYELIAVNDQRFIVASVDNIKARSMGLLGPCPSCARAENKKRRNVTRGEVSLAKSHSFRLLAVSLVIAKLKTLPATNCTSHRTTVGRRNGNQKQAIANRQKKEQQDG